MKIILPLALLVLVSCGYQGDTSAPERTISVSGYSHTKIKPDKAQLYINIRHESHTVQQSRKLVTTDISNLIRALAELGIEPSQIKQGQISQGKRYQWDNVQRKQVATGFYSSSELVVLLDEVALLNKVHLVLSQYDQLRINHTDFEVTKEHDIQNEQLTKATLQAHSKAKAMAKGLGLQVGNVISIVEMANGANQPYLNVKRAEMAAQSERQAEVQDINIDAKVNVVFAAK